jgi:hypothetical protein
MPASLDLFVSEKATPIPPTRPVRSTRPAGHHARPAYGVERAWGEGAHRAVACERDGPEVEVYRGGRAVNVVCFVFVFVRFVLVMRFHNLSILLCVYMYTYTHMHGVGAALPLLAYHAAWP